MAVTAKPFRRARANSGARFRCGTVSVREQTKNRSPDAGVRS